MKIGVDAEWWFLAACKGMDLELFFTRALEIEAMRVCMSCPVRRECKEENDGWEVTVTPAYWSGVFGGEPPSRRRKRLGQAPSEDEPVSSVGTS